MLGEEFLDASVEVQLVFWPVEAVTFVGINDVGDFAFRLAQGSHHGIAGGNRHPGIVLSLSNKEWCANLVDVIERRHLPIEFLIMVEIAAPPSPTRHYDRPVTGKGAKVCRLIGWADDIHPARKLEILLHAATVFVIPGVEELQSEAGRAAIVYLEDSVTAVGQELNFRLVVIMITIPRAAVNRERRWRILGVHARRSR